MQQRIPADKRSKSLQSYYDNLESRRAIQRERAKARYYADKEAKLLANAKYRKENPEKMKAIRHLSNAKYNKRRFFFTRALSAITHVGSADSPDQVCAILSRAWYNQRGRCAYTGKRLGRDAQVDHKVPVSRGGTNAADNLHWVTPAANFVKRDKTHDEFVALCVDIAQYIEKNTPKGLKGGVGRSLLGLPI
jgi:CRISPR/Cas system Type II protein with McrA/HNH and RuvC-like nuclease domain